MHVRAVVGLQWGDEGKGKIVDLLSSAFQHVVRAQGGPNAGHTVEVGELKIALHQIPSGVVHPDIQCYLGAGMVIDPKELLKEIEELERAGLKIQERLHISPRAHLILPRHKSQEKELEETQKIGTTGKGIGPAYADKALRIGECAETSALLAPFLADVESLLHAAMKRGESILLEGAQGALLDNTFGTYPFVTSSCTLSAGLCAGSGIEPTALTEVVGVAKAYTTRVGEGPFPTEHKIDIAEEFGTTTGRKRRIGWFNAIDVKKAAKINGCTWIALTKLDVLDTLEEIKVAIGYGEGAGVPIYETLEGWQFPIGEIHTWERLPQGAREYVLRLEQLLALPIRLISVGPKRNATIERP